VSGETAVARPAAAAASAPPTSSASTVVGTPSRHGSWAAVLRAVTRDRLDQIVFLLTAAVVGIGCSLLLPFAFTKRISFANWSYLDARYVAFTVAFEENLLLLGSRAPLVASGPWSLRKLSRAVCLIDRCPATPAGPGHRRPSRSCLRGAQSSMTGAAAASLPARRRP
jgi:hypothetical protein